MKTFPYKQPSHLIIALADVKISGSCNLFNCHNVISTLKNMGYNIEALWLEENRSHYVAVLYEFSQWWQTNHSQQESLAQRVARECGLEVIVD